MITLQHMDVSGGVGAVRARWSTDDGLRYLDIQTEIISRYQSRWRNGTWDNPAKRNVMWYIEGPIIFGLDSVPDINCSTWDGCIAMQWLFKAAHHERLGGIPFDTSHAFRLAAAELHAALLAHYARAVTRALRRRIGRRRRAQTKVALALTLAAPHIAHVLEPLVLAWMPW